MDATSPRDETEVWLKLSAAQRALWLETQLATDHRRYQLGGWAEIGMDIDVDIASQAVSLTMARHDALRLRVDPHLPRQRLDGSVAPPIGTHDVSAEASPDAAFRCFAAAAFESPLAPGDGPLFRFDLVRAGASRWFAMFRCHHLISDFVSVVIALHRWAEAYDALSGEGSAELAPPSSFTAMLEADAAYENSPQHDSDLAYWHKRITTLPEPLFPPIVAAASGAPERWQLAGADCRAFMAACRSLGVSAQRAVLGLLALSLGNLFSRREVAFGLALHRRDLATRNTVGMFAGLLPVRCAIEPQDSIAANLRAIAAGLDADLRHYRIALDALGRTLSVGRDAAGAAVAGMQLFDVVVSHLAEDATPAGLTLCGQPVNSQMVRGPERVPLALYVMEGMQAGVIDFELAYNPAFVDRTACRAVLDGLRLAIESFIAQPDGWADELDILSPPDRALVVTAWNATEAAFPTGSLVDLFAAQVVRSPDAPAVVDGDRTLSYADLDAASDALAAALRARGIARETPVGVALHRSAETVIALLGILKAGAVYLPLDPAYPAERLAFMLHDAAAALVLTEAAVAEQLPPDMAQWRVRDILASPAAALQRDVIPPAQLAYIVYTSGSTGTPKGVAVSHASAANLAFARTAGHDPIGPGDRVLAAISVGFDVSIGQLLLPLLVGASVVIAPDLRTLSAAEFWALVVAQRVSHINSVPSFFDSILDAAPAQAPLRRLMLGGEVLNGSLCRRLRAALPGLEVVNMYGPTEACIDATAHVVAAAAPDGPLPIGRPLANYRCYVLDRRLRPLPPGVVGELYLGGAGVARGYVGQPGLTASRFVADPFGAPGGRLYRTGDRARWSSEGRLMFLGRSDGQLKIRGFRVEPGEIEAALCRHAGVAQAAVAAPVDRHGTARLVAYVVPAAGTMPPAAALRAHLAQQLPAHMVPASYVALTALPLTSNGKLDRNALPRPDGEGAGPGHVVARDDMEFRLQVLCQDILGIPAIGVTEDFFELGGDSLLAIKLIGACNAAFSTRIPMSALFAHPTIEAMAVALRQNATLQTKWPLVTLRSGGSAAPLVCLPPQGGTVFCYAPLIRQLPGGFPVFGLQAAGLNEAETLSDSIEAMAASYLAALRRVQPDKPFRLLGYSFGGLVAFEMARQLLRAGQAVGFLGLIDTWRPGGSAAPSATEAEILGMLADEIGLPAREAPIGGTAALHHAAANAGLLPPDFSAEQLERIVAVHMNNARIAERYRPVGGLPIPVLQVRALRRDVELSDWAPMIDGPVETCDLDYSHRQLIAAEAAPSIMTVLSKYLVAGSDNHE